MNFSSKAKQPRRLSACHDEVGLDSFLVSNLTAACGATVAWSSLYRTNAGTWHDGAFPAAVAKIASIVQGVF